MILTDPNSQPTASRRYRYRKNPSMVALLALACLFSACSAAGVSAPAVHGHGRGLPPTRVADQSTSGDAVGLAKAASAATGRFQSQVDGATGVFLQSVDALQSDAASGDIAGARAAEIAAQSAYDAFRVLDAQDQINASSLDELASAVAPDESFGGLHAIERDLWEAGPLSTDVAALAAQAPAAAFLLSRERLGPEAIGTVAVNQLDWVADVALPVGQEQYSHLGLIDIAATESDAHATFDTIRPLAQLVDPSLASRVAAEFAALDAQVGALGPPGTTPDTSVTAAARLALTQQLDATASTLARLAAQLTPYGTAGAPS